jgi:hypothetical protein
MIPLIHLHFWPKITFPFSGNQKAMKEMIKIELSDISKQIGFQIPLFQISKLHLNDILIYLFIYLHWQYCCLNLGTHACKTDALPLEFHLQSSKSFFFLTQKILLNTGYATSKTLFLRDNIFPCVTVATIVLVMKWFFWQLNYKHIHT